MENFLKNLNTKPEEVSSVPPENTPSPKDEIEAFFESLFSYKRYMSHPQLFDVVSAHKLWLSRKQAGLECQLTWQTKYDLTEMLKWLKANYPK
jgi:hypothetical protein